ncbi:NAD(P)-dependent alcohol dehydrogenase [Paeniglutamicibacter sp. MACA_103]|uniref:NAD(P)-dependent alcohol dehydrogenase n=1 Tax=Paeniglutamicibacter sp. MACA_103 TaxID=3377337 RepID=UPI00389464C5
MIPENMSASILIAPKRVQVQTVPVPIPESDQVLVRIEAVGVCGSDTHFYLDGHIGDMVVTEPLILGHEAAGTIVAVGSDVDSARIGQRVSIEPQKPCTTCEYCLSGRYNLCVCMEFYAAPPVNGAFAEYAVIQAKFAYEVPDSVSIEAAALLEPLSVAIAACRSARVTPGSRVLVAGAGPIGLLVARVSVLMGASEVKISDPVQHRRDMAVQGWATEAIDPRTPKSASEIPWADVFIDASGAAPAIQAGIRSLKPRGRTVLVGMGADDVLLPVSVIQNREIELTGIFRYVDTWPAAIEMVATDAVDIDALITNRFGLHRVEEALLCGSEDPFAIKSVIIP